MSRPAHMGLDIGGTASRWVLCDDDGVEMARGAAPGATGHVFNPAEKDKLRGVFTTIAGAVGQQGFVVDSVTAGITGYGPAVSEGVAALLGEAGIAAASVTLIDDIALAYLANFAPGEGHLISAGTGSIGIHIGQDGKLVRVGGRGILIDDAGSGSWIALRALDAIYRALDNEGSFGSVERLAQHLLAQVGGDAWSDVRQFVYGGDRGRIGALSVAVAKAAEEGDAVALAILREAGAELALLATALIRRCGGRPIGLVGRVLSLHPVVLDEVRRRHVDAGVSVLAGDAPLAAARLQMRGPQPWREPLARLSRAAD